MTVFNPIRRNRNIGTAAQGYGRDNRLVVPDPRGPRRYEELIGSFSIETHQLHGSPLLIVIEQVRPGWFHSCTPEDVVKVLRCVPAAELHLLESILFRQPTEKQAALNPVWGRLTYSASLGVSNEPHIYEGPLITLDAQRHGATFRWSRSMSLGAQKELERLRAEGHLIDEHRRHFYIRSTPESIRRTQLFRTLLHELGHWVDYLTKVEYPGAKDIGLKERLQSIYFARPPSEREAFAHGYAKDQWQRICEIQSQL